MLTLRTAVATILTLGPFTTPLVAAAQRPSRVPRIGVIGGRSPDRVPGLAADLVRGAVDVLVVGGAVCAPASLVERADEVIGR